MPRTTSAKTGGKATRTKAATAPRRSATAAKTPKRTAVKKVALQQEAVTQSPPRWRVFLGAARHNRFAHLLVLWALSYMVLSAYFFSEVLNASNTVEVFPREFAFPLLLHAVTALLVAGVMHLLPRPRTFGPKAVAVVVATLFLVNYDERLTAVAPIIKPLLPILPADPLPVVSLLFLTLLCAIAVGIGMLLELAKRRWENVTSTNVLGLACMVVGVLFAGQAMNVLRVTQDTRPESRHVPTAELAQAATMQPITPDSKPDIYYIVLDRYTNNTVLKNQFGFDNAPFLDGLRAKGFSVNDNALSAYPYTAPSVASTLNMSYNNDDVRAFKDRTVQSATLFHNMAEQSQAVKLLQSRGYAYHSVGAAYGASYEAPLTDYNYACDRKLEIAGKAKCLRGIEALQWEKSIFYRFANVGVKGWPVHYAETHEVEYVRSQVQTLHDLANSQKQGGRFIFAHLLVPHDPFYFKADGSQSIYTGVDNVGMPVKQKYLQQLQFINTQMDEIIGEIQRNSGGNAVIMLVSDEGPYPASMNQTFLKPAGWDTVGDIISTSDMTKWTPEDLWMKFGILEAYYIPQATADDFAAISPPNAFRVVLDRYFGYSFPYLPKCQMGLPEGRKDVYRFKDISELMTGATDAACKQYE